MPIPAIALAGIPSVVKGISGLFGIFKGNKRAKNNQFPITEVNANIQKNAALADQMASQGLPAAQYNLALQNLNRNRAGALSAVSRSANPSAGINSLLRASNDATLGLDAQNAGARLNNQRFAFGQRSALANEQNRVFNWNKAKRYQDEADAASQQIASGKSNAFGSLTDLSQIAAAYLGSENGDNSQPTTSSTPSFFSQMGRYGTPNYNTTFGRLS